MIEMGSSEGSREGMMVGRARGRWIKKEGSKGGATRESNGGQ